MNEEFVSIEIISERAGLPRSTVQRYTRLGFVRPQKTLGRTVLYCEADAARLRKIARLTRDLGLNLAGVDIVLRLTDELLRIQSDR